MTHEAARGADAQATLRPHGENGTRSTSDTGVPTDGIRHSSRAGAPASLDRALTWTGMLRAALARGNYPAAGSYARHIADLADQLREGPHR